MIVKIQKLLQTNKITLVWLLVTAIYLGLKLSHTDAPEFTNVFVTVTGIFVGDLGIKQTRKKSEESARVEQKADSAIVIAGHAVEAATGEIPPIITDPHTGQLKPQQPPKIFKGDKDA